MVLIVYAMRLGLTRYIFRDGSYTLRDAAVTSMMAPKGLAAAVLAALPLEKGIQGGELIRDTTYMVVLVSITLTALLVMLYRFPATQRLYALALGKRRSGTGEQ
jgi:cell volume regulation protein A